MTDKKSCKSCGIGNCAGCTNFSKWTRNPRQWLLILPTEPGWYWWRDNLNASSQIICIALLELGKLKHGQYQGPIKPEGR